MSKLLRVVSIIPLSTERRLLWQRTLIERAYAKEISIAIKNNDIEKVRSLKSERDCEMELHGEEEDAHLTRTMLSNVRDMRIPIPPRHDKHGAESDLWYQGHHTGGWYLTDQGIAFLRSEIRQEHKARHELRAQWIPWLLALTGLVGSITGLVALLK